MSTITVSSRTVSLRSFRVGRVKAYRRGKVWYLCYHENGQRRRPKVGPERDAAKKMAAQINGQLETGAASTLSFEPISIPDLRKRWLDHHEHVLRSSVHTIDRYRTATDHLLNFLRDVRSVRLASLFSSRDAEELVRYLRTIEVAPNGHKNSKKRPLLDKGIKYILECCRALLSYAAKRRHLSPYAENPFAIIQIDRVPVENAKPIVLFTPEQEKQFLETCNDWQFPIFLTLMITGLRPGELCHLLIDDLDLQGDAPVLRVRNKPQFGWQVKTRSERVIPLVPELAAVLRIAVGTCGHGPAFKRNGWCGEATWNLPAMQQELAGRVTQKEKDFGQSLGRKQRLTVAKSVWWEIGAIREDRLRSEFMKVTSAIGLAHVTMPKLLRHSFATSLQEANVDPLVRNLLMGHSPSNATGQAVTSLGMTAQYTHTRPETIREQLTSAVAKRKEILAIAGKWLEHR